MSSRILSSTSASTSSFFPVHKVRSQVASSIRGNGRRVCKTNALLKAAEGYTPSWTQTTDDVLIKVGELELQLLAYDFALGV